MERNVKFALLEAGEEVTKVALDQALKVAEAYAESSESQVDDTIVAAVKLLHDTFLKDLADKINPED